MNKVQRFEDFVAWQKARELTGDVYGVTRHGEFARDFGLRDQIQRSSVSVMSNIAEGYERNNPNEFAHFLNISKGSCAEVRSLLYVALDVQYIDQVTFDTLMQSAEKVGSLVAGLRRSVEQRRP